MTRPLPPDPRRQPVRITPRRTAKDVVAGLGALLALVALLGGVPYALLRYAGPPLPAELLDLDLLTERLGTSTIVAVLVLFVWLAWLQLVACVVVEVYAGIRRVGMPARVPLAGGTQALANRLVSAVLLLFTATAVTVPAAYAQTTAPPPAVALATSAQEERAAPTPAQRPPALMDVRSVKKVYTVQPPEGRHHESLWEIAEKCLGEGRRYKEIYELNKHKVQPDGSRLRIADLIRPGWVLDMPDDAVNVHVVPADQSRAETLARHPGAPAELDGRTDHDTRTAKAGDTGTGDARAGDMETGGAEVGDAGAGDAKAGGMETGDARAGDAEAGGMGAGDAEAGGAWRGRPSADGSAQDGKQESAGRQGSAWEQEDSGKPEREGAGEPEGSGEQQAEDAGTREGAGRQEQEGTGKPGADRPGAEDRKTGSGKSDVPLPEPALPTAEPGARPPGGSTGSTGSAGAGERDTRLPSGSAGRSADSSAESSSRSPGAGASSGTDAAESPGAGTSPGKGTAGAEPETPQPTRPGTAEQKPDASERAGTPDAFERTDTPDAFERTGIPDASERADTPGASERSDPSDAFAGSAGAFGAAWAGPRAGGPVPSPDKPDKSDEAADEVDANRHGGRHAAEHDPSTDRDVGQDTDQDTDRDVDQDSGLDLVDYLAGASLAAAGLLVALGRRRREQLWRRLPGRRVARPRGDAATAELALRLGADTPGGRMLDLGLRLLGRLLAEQGRTPPTVYAAHLSAHGLDLWIHPPQPAAPEPWTAQDGGQVWRLPAHEGRWIDEYGLAGAAAPYPGLVSLGTDEGGRVLVDLEAAQGLIAVTGAHTTAALAALAVELATNRWSDGMRITLVGFGEELTAIAPDRVRYAATLGEVLPELEAEAARARLGGDVLTGRIAARAAYPAHPPHYLLSALRPQPAEAERLAVLARTGVRTATGYVIAGEAPHATWTWRIDAEGTVRVDELGLAVRAQLLPRRHYAAIVDLFRTAEDMTGERLRPCAAPLPEEPPEIEVRILGPIEIGPVGPLAEGRADLATEMVVYLATHPGGVHPAVLGGMLWPRGVPPEVRDSAVARVAAWLGADSAGRPHLYADEAGRLRLGPGVRTDWQLFRDLVRRGELDRALGLVRGPLLNGRPAGRYAWLAADVLEYDVTAEVADAAHRLCAARLAAGDPDGAMAAVRAGLLLAADDEGLWRDLLCAAHATGEPARLRAVVDALHRRATSHPYGGGMSPQTEALIDELLPSWRVYSVPSA